MAFLHDQGIVHRDIKPANLVADFTDSTAVKLFVIDFGVAMWYSEEKPLCMRYCGTEEWTAPEVIDNGRWDPKPADVWAAAKTLSRLADVCILNQRALQMTNDSTSS